MPAPASRSPAPTPATRTDNRRPAAATRAPVKPKVAPKPVAATTVRPAVRITPKPAPAPKPVKAPPVPVPAVETGKRPPVSPPAPAAATSQPVVRLNPAPAAPETALKTPVAKTPATSARPRPPVRSRRIQPLGKTPGAGQPLPDEIQSRLAQSFDADLSAVRIHSDQKAQSMARSVGARAFTYGSHIFLGPGERATDLPLIAHEMTHVLQQSTRPSVQRWSLAGGGDSHEREAQRGGQAAARGEMVTVREHLSAPRIQRWSLSSALDRFADWANNIPGFSMLTFVIGFNPINMSRVERNATNLFRAVVGFMPGGDLIFRALQNHGILERVGGWLQQQLNSLGMAASTFKNALDEFLDSLSWSDIFDLDGVWERAKRIFTAPIDRIISFLGGLVSDILKFIRDAILRPVARLAEGTRAYDLMRLVLGYDPITNDPYPPTAENMIGGFMRLIGQEEKWQHLQQSRAIPRAWAWFQSQLGALMGFVSQIPGLFLQLWDALQIGDLLDIPGAFNKVRNIFGGFVSSFISWAGNAALEIMMFIFEALAPGAMPVLRRAASVIRTIIGNPIGFVGNLVRAAKQGFQQFGSNIRTHLINGLVGWLTGALSGAGLSLPARWDLRGILSLVLQILGLTWQNIRQKLVRAIGETPVRVLETGFQLVVTLVREGPAAAWQQILQHMQNLQEMVMSGIRDWVVQTIVTQAVMRIVSMFNPAGAVIQAIIAIYNTVMFFRERLTQIIQVAESFFNSIAAIAGGNIGAAANLVERTMARLLPVVISFLARLIGLGGISERIRAIIARIRAPIDRALDRVVDWIKNLAMRFLARLTGTSNLNPQQRLDRGLESAQRAVNRFAGRRVGGVILRPLLAGIRVQYQMQALDVAERGTRWVVRGAVNPTGERPTEAQVQAGDAPDGSREKPYPIAWPKRPLANYRSYWLTDPKEVSGPTPQAQIQTKPSARLFSPAAGGTLPGGSDTVGIAGNFQTRLNLVVGPKKTGRSESEMNRFKRVWARHGYDRSEEPTDADHVVELQMSGTDSFSNLWPLNSSENRSGGSTLVNTNVTIEDGTTKKVGELLGKYFKITSFTR